MPVDQPVVEFATSGFFTPLTGAAVAARTEALGFDIQVMGVNECVTPDVFTELRMAAESTERVKLMAGVLNLVTRHPSVVASGMAAIQLASGGRAIAGLGKGDSAVGMIGRKPQRHDDYVRDASLVRAYLQGETTTIEGVESRLRWLPDDYVPVPVDMFASGPKSIAAAAAIADRITFSIGANPEYVAWALDIVDTTLASTGRSRDDVQIGACIPFAIDRSVEAARDALRPFILGWAHMSSFAGNDLSRQPEPLRKVNEVMRSAYSYDHHTLEDAPTSGLLDHADDQFVDWFGVAGTADMVTEHLLTLWDLGLRHFLVATEEEQKVRLAEQVMPQVRQEVARRSPTSRPGQADLSR